MRKRLTATGSPTAKRKGKGKGKVNTTLYHEIGQLGKLFADVLEEFRFLFELHVRWHLVKGIPTL